jgi:hypothetical protein
LHCNCPLRPRQKPVIRKLAVQKQREIYYNYASDL